MANKIILADTSVLIDLFRKTNKENSLLVSLVRLGYSYSISAITEYEIYVGAGLGQLDYWNTFLQKTSVLAFDSEVAKVASELNKQLKKKRKLIDAADLFIASTAIKYRLPLATLNRRHFERIDGLIIFD
ncbi:putative nucleic acid-binding protein [Filimonas zeae]|uniref:Ribonuclease VapC n=1 Tax=Filimonas zeae TaxID=1737353 RepID=A0A917IUV3_9BACT|nr:type II toxin-antitoxin system VapC family toxin [Filimonas zeae]MDR6339078.1 putative nucleic acid-binding protein [Filimonas zeae]GGH65199.1 ribonuclease VapC [Filimonas zeae]